MKIVIKTYDDGWTPCLEMREQEFEIENTDDLAILLNRFDVVQLSYRKNSLFAYVWNKGEFWPKDLPL